MTGTSNLLSYALAIFQIAGDRKTIEKYYSLILKMDDFNNKHSDFSKIFSSRAIDKKDRRDLVATFMKKMNIPEVIIHWVWVIIDDNNFGKFHLIARECRKLHHVLFNTTRVDVVSAFELTGSQKAKLINFFTKRLNTLVDLKITVDPSLIGGLRIQINNKTYANTVKLKLHSLKEELLTNRGDQ